MTAKNFNLEIDRRTLFISALAGPLSGCGFAPYGVDIREWGKAIGFASGLENPPDIAREQIEQIPFATIGYRIGDSAESVLVLGEKSQTSSLWTSAQRLAIVTSRGRILQTSGFHWNLSSTNFVEPDPVGTTLFANPLGHSFQRFCDFADISKFQISIAADFEIQKEETISILGSDLRTNRVVEHCRCEKLDWEFDNFYWIDQESGFVWQTIQSVHPNERPFRVNVLRPES